MFTVLLHAVSEQKHSASSRCSGDTSQLWVGLCACQVLCGSSGRSEAGRLVLVHDRPSYYKILICTLVGASSVVTILLIIGM